MGLNNLSLLGAPANTGSGLPWGMVPQVPDPLSTAATAVGGNLTNLGGLTDLASRVNAFNTQQAVNPYIANLPGYQSMVNQSSGNIGSLLQGQIPADVLNLLGQRAAERGVGTGLAGSPNANSAAMQALGLTSLGLQQQGEGELTQAIGRTPTAPLFNVAQFLTTPGEEQAAQLAANIYAAAPDPQKQAQALIDLFTRFMGRLGQGTGSAPFVIPSGSGPSPYTPGNNAAGGGTPMPPGGGVLSRPITGLTGNRNVGAAPGATGGFPTQTTTPTFPGGPNSFLNQTFAQPAFQNRSTLGNIGLDPVLNALFGGGPGGGGGFGAPIESPGFGYDLNQQGTDFSQLLGSPITAPPLDIGNTGFGQPPIDLSHIFNPAYGNTGTLGYGLDPTLNALFGSGLFGGQTQQPITFGNQPPPLTLGTGGFGAPITSGSLLGGGGMTSGLTDAQLQTLIDEGLLPGESPEDFIG